MNMIRVSGHIHIRAPHQTVFAYYANLEQDKNWRKEINDTKMSGTPGIGATATESSFLSKKVPKNILKLECIEFSNNKRIVYETIPGSPFRLKSTREVEPVSEKETRVTYTVEFDKAIVKHGLGFNLPAFLVTMVTRKDMKKYLKKLKLVFEENKQAK